MKDGSKKLPPDATDEKLSNSKPAEDLKEDKDKEGLSHELQT